jgi:hypothetical protein
MSQPQQAPPAKDARKCPCGWLYPQIEIDVQAQRAFPAEVKLSFTVKITCPKCQRETVQARQN